MPVEFSTFILRFVALPAIQTALQNSKEVRATVDRFLDKLWSTAQPQAVTALLPPRQPTAHVLPAVKA